MQRVAILLALVTSVPLASCTDPSEEGMSQSILLARIGLVLGEDDEGHLVGLNLDDRVDDVASPDACFSVDGVAPDGVPGIDNEFAVLGGLIVSLLGANPDAIVQSSINDGRLLIIAELSDVQDFTNDPEVTVQIHIGTGPVDVGTDGLPEPSQSFDLSERADTVLVTEAAIEDGRLTATGFDIDIDVSVLQARFVVRLRDATLQLDLRDGGEEDAEGVLGGTLDRTELRDIIANDDVLQEALPAVDIALAGLPDISQSADGVCDGISTGFSVTGRPAFLLTP